MASRHGDALFLSTYGQDTIARPGTQEEKCIMKMYHRMWSLVSAVVLVVL